MKAFLVLAVLSLAAIGMAAGEQLEFLAGQAETQVFFLDCQQLQIVTASLRLTDCQGHDVPFSLDWRWELPPDLDRNYGSDGRFAAKPNGYSSKWLAPAQESRFAQLGWLSFRKRPGCEKYTLRFATGTGAATARPAPDLRPWWIELMRDPLLQDLSKLTSAAGSLTAHPDGGVEFAKSFFWPQGCYLVGEPLKGRRLMAMTRLASCSGNFNVPFYNAVIKKTTAINCYFKVDSPTDILVESRVDNLPGELFRTTRGGLFLGKDQTAGKGRMWFFHLQSPPENGGIDMRLNATLFNLGDQARITVSGFGHELLYQAAPGLARVENWEPEYNVLVKLLDPDGREVASCHSAAFPLTGLAPGRYTMAVSLHSKRENPEVIAAQAFAFELQNGPDWK
ncbi:MAG: hypothetical protein GX564_05790 [Oligosphaeraceae bacterium]|nr:hypothetical protein [Oligosphaeraceae bacterium]